MQSDVIEISDLRFSYPSRPPVLEVKNFRLGAGEKVFLHGPSGTGKTTFLGLLAGILEAREGSLKFLGNELVRLSGSKRDALRGESLGYIFQMFNLIPYLNAFENILLPCRMSVGRRHNKTLDQLENDAREMARALGIEHVLANKVTELSVGQQQRVAVARALLGAPPVILADEPTSALDADARVQFMSLLFELCEKKNTALLFVSHDRSLATGFDRNVSLAEINILGRAAR